MKGAPIRPRLESRFYEFARSALARGVLQGIRVLAGSLTLPALFGLSTLFAGAALANGIPEPGQIGFQEAVTPIAHEIEFFHNWILLPIIISICVFVLALLVYVDCQVQRKSQSGACANDPSFRP